MGEELNNFGLHVTKPTHDWLGPDVIEGIAQGLPEDKKVFLTTSQDFNPETWEPSQEYLDSSRAIGIQPNSAAEINLSNLFANIAGRTGAAVPKTSPSLELSEEQIQNAIPIGEGMNDPDACIITIPDNGNDPWTYADGSNVNLGNPLGFFEATLFLPPEKLDKDLSRGNVQDLQLFIGHHEGDHCENLGNKFYEYESDTHANRQYARNLASGVALDAELPYTIRAHRAGAAMMGVSGEAYLTNGLTPLAGEKPLNDAQLTEAKEQIIEAQDRVYDRIEYQTGMTRDQLAGDVDKGIFPDPDMAELRARHVYQETKMMLEAGELDDLPYAKQTAERFVDGAERYGHELYNVLPEDRIYDSPEMPAQAYGMGLLPLGLNQPVQQQAFVYGG